METERLKKNAQEIRDRANQILQDLWTEEHISSVKANFEEISQTAGSMYEETRDMIDKEENNDR